MNDLKIKFLFFAVLTAPLAAQQAPAPTPAPPVTTAPTASPAPTQTSPSPSPTEEPEAPEALFSEKIGDVGVELDAQGSWTTHLAAGWGAGFTPQGTLPGLGYPGYTKQPVFEQIPDFSLTLWLFKRYFFQVNYRTTTDDRSFELGYQGLPGEFLQWIKVGNAPFSVPERAGEQLPEGRSGAPAAGAAFSLGNVQTEMLARYEDGSRETHTYRGYTDVSQTNIGIDAWIRGRFFQLPTGPYSGIRVLVEDPTGAFGGFRDAQVGEVTIDSNTGEIRLPASATKRYLVTWSTAPSGSIPYPASMPPGSTPILHITAQEFNNSSLPAGSHWYVLTQPGLSTAFELRNRYPVTAGGTGQILLYDNDTNLVVPGWPVSQSPANDWFEVGDTTKAEAPFFSANSYTFEGIYPYQNQGAPPPSSKVLPWAFRLPSSTTANSYPLGTDVVPSSIIVERNGVETSAWKFDASSGQLTFDTPVFDTDTIVISLQRRKSTNAASDLVLWNGGRWDISDQQSLEWNIQSRWNLSKDQTTNEDLQSPGRIAGTVAWTARAGEWNWSLTGTAGALKSDSTGHRILYDQGDSGTQAALDGDALRPSASPQDSLSTFGTGSLTESNRSPAIYRNYWTNDPVTGEAVAGQYGNPGVNDEASVAGGNVGPYLVLGDGTRSDRMAVLEANPTVGRWAGMQVFTDKGTADDLRSTSAITVNIRVPNGSGLGSGDKLYLQAGHLSTDFDGTHSVRAVTYRSTPVLTFLNQKDGFTQYFPIPEGSVWGNDPTKAGSTVPDGDLVSFDLGGATGFSTVSPDWQTVRLVLTDAQRQSLQSTNGWRLVLYRNSGSGTQTVLVGPVIFEGSTWSVVADNSTTGTVTPAELDSGNSRNLQVNWATRPSWSVQGRNSPVRPLSYGTIAFSYQMSSHTTASTMTVKLSDYKGQGITATWPVGLTDNGLHRARIAIRGKTITVDGAVPPLASVTLSSGALTTSWDRMTISQSGSSDGTLTVSEIQAVDPLWEPIGNTLATATWTQGAAWPSTDFPVVSGMTVGLTSRQEGVTAETASWIGQTTWTGSVGPIRSSGLASYTTTPMGTQAHGEYEATLPLAGPGGSSVALTDQFSDQGLRAEHVVVSVPYVGTFDTMAKVSGAPVTLDQDYRASWNGLWSDWGGSLSAEWAQSRPFEGTAGNFGQQWMTSWSWLTPEADTAPYYLLQSQATTKTPFFGGPLETLVRGQVAQSVGPETTWSPAASWQLRSTMKVGDTGWSVSPSLTRQVSSVFDRAQVSPQDSVRTAGSWIASQPGGLFSIPFSEIGSSSPWSEAPAGLDSGTLQTAARLDWDRSSRQDWTDLALPHSGGLDYTTTRGIDGAAGYRIYQAGAHLEAQGLNLFGSLGSEPVFPWYRTDVWTWTTTGTWQTGTRVQDRLAQASAATRAELVLTEEESLALPATYQATWGASPAQTWTVGPTWSLKRAADLPFDLPRWLSPRSFRRLWVQEISTSLTFGWSPDGAPPLRDLQVSWKGRFLLSDKSELDFTTQWGQQWQTNLMVVGLEASLDFVLSF